MQEKELREKIDNVFTLTQQGIGKVTDYMSHLEAKRKDILDAGLDTVDEDDLGLPAVGGFVNALQNFYDPELKEYCDGWGVTPNYEADYPLRLELNKDFIKTKILQVNRMSEDRDDDAWITYKQGNRIGTKIIAVGELEDRKNEYKSMLGNDNLSDRETVEEMILLGDMLDVPNLKELPLIDEQSHAIQTVFRMSSQDETGGYAYINMDNYHQLLGDIFLDNIPTNASIETAVQQLQENVAQIPELDMAIQFLPPEHAAAEGVYVIIYPEFPTYFAMRDKHFRDMVKELDESLKEIASESSTKEAGRLTLEDALAKRDIEKEDIMELMNNAAKSKVKHPGYFTAADDVLKFDTQDDRKKSAKLISQWMRKPGKRIAKELQDLKARSKAQGR